MAKSKYLLKEEAFRACFTGVKHPKLHDMPVIKYRFQLTVQRGATGPTSLPGCEAQIDLLLEDFGYGSR